MQRTTRQSVPKQDHDGGVQPAVTLQKWLSPCQILLDAKAVGNRFPGFPCLLFCATSSYAPVS